MAAFFQLPLEMERSIHITGCRGVPAIESHEDAELDTAHRSFCRHSATVADSEAYAQRRITRASIPGSD